MIERPFSDFYETLQISPNADSETIQRVYRFQAQRFHPDNPDTGDLEIFRLMSDAYRTLMDPGERAAYDLAYRATKGRQWKIFDQPTAARGMEAERKKRFALLSVLYTQRLNDPERPYLSLVELEEVLACPREHLEFGLWYLRETQSIQRTDNARYTITAKGVETLEASDQSPLASRFLLGEPEKG